MPPPIVPPPTTTARLTSRVAVSRGMSGIFAASRSEKKKYCWARACAPPISSAKISCSQAIPSSKGRSTAASTVLMHASGASKPRIRRACLFRNASKIPVSPRAGATFSSRSRMRTSGRPPPAARRANAMAPLGEIALHDLVGEPVGERLAGADGVAAHDHLESLLRPHYPRQSLRAPRPGTQAELDLGEPEARGCVRDPEVAGKRGFEPAPERGAVNRGDHRLRRVVEHVDHLEEARGLERLVEFGDVRAGDERATRAGEHDAAHVPVGDRLAHGVADPLPHVPAQGVDGGIVDGDDGDAVTNFELNRVRLCGHEGSRAVPNGGSAPTSGGSYHPTLRRGGSPRSWARSHALRSRPPP